MELGDADELFEVDARERIHVCLGLALGGDGNRELTCRLPAERSLVADHLGQIGQERDAPERVLWTLVAHIGMVGGWWPSPSRAPSPSQRAKPFAEGRTVVVTGAAGAVGRRVLARLEQDPGVARVVAIDVADVIPGQPKTEQRRLDLALADAPALLKSADTLIHLAFSSRTETNEPEAARVNVETTSRLLDAASASGVDQVVVVSSATVYGAWANNPVPLTEDAPLRPNPEFAYAVHKAQVERLVTDWADAHDEASVAVLRPALALAEDGAGWITRCLMGAAGIRAGDNDPPMQFLHLDDLASAVEHVRRGAAVGPVQRRARRLDPRRHRAGACRRRAPIAPTRRRRDSPRRVELAHAARSDAAGTRAVHPVPVGRRERSPPRERLGTALEQRGGVRCRSRRLAVVDAEPQATTGARARSGGGWAPPRSASPPGCSSERPVGPGACDCADPRASVDQGFSGLSTSVTVAVCATPSRRYVNGMVSPGR